MEMIGKWTPTVAISHAEGCVTNAIISPELAQKIFRLVTDELNGTGEGPKKDIETIKRECHERYAPDKPPCNACTTKKECGYIIVTKARDPENIHEGISSATPEKSPKFCAVEGCLTLAEEGYGVCEFHGGGEPEGRSNVQVSDPKKSEHTGGKQSHPTIDEGLILLKEGKKPDEVFRILEEKHGDKGPSRNLIYQWRYKLKKAGELPDKGAKEEPTKKAPTYDGLHSVTRKPEDLMIIKGEVMCPKTSVATECEGQECNTYIGTLLVDGEPHIRCAKAGG